MASELETRVLRKITYRIVPFIMLLYFIAFIDRVNIGFASLTMNKDLGFSPSVFGFGAGIFFLGYFLFEVPSNLILEKVGARIWIARVMITWGLIGCTMALVQGPFYAVRLFVGEIGTFAGIKTDAAARVIDKQDQPCPGLYAVGNDQCSVFAGAYPGPGSMLGPAMTFGYIAGRHAAGVHEASDSAPQADVPVPAAALA